MKVALVPTYSDIFDGPIVPIQKLLEGISIEILTNIISVINAELFTGIDNKRTQLNILKFLLRLQNTELKKSILLKISSFYVKNGQKDFAIFSPHITLEFLHYCVIELPKNTKKEDTTPSQELNFFKAYLIFSKLLNEKSVINDKPSEPLEFFQHNIWPNLIGQLEINHNTNFLTSLIKAKSLFDFLQYESEFDESVKKFLQANEIKDTWSYISILINALKNGISTIKTPSGLNPFFIKTDNEINLFEDLCFDYASYNDNYKAGKNNYSGFKEKPLVKFAPNVYLVLHWNLLGGKLYNYLIFDFFKKSGIGNHITFKNKDRTFLSFKQFIGTHFIDNFLFRKLITSIFTDKRTVIEFDDDKEQGFPDAYVRTGNKIFLFEIKDALFSAKSIESFDFTMIRGKIDEKYNSKRKGTGQLIKQLMKLESRPFEKKDYALLQLKQRNLVIYPVIIYTDIFFSMPGISLYLQNEFNARVTENNIIRFKAIKPLAFFNIDFLIENIDLLKMKDFQLGKVIDYVSRQIVTRKNKYEKNMQSSNLHLWNDNFETIASKKLESNIRTRNYVNYVFEELDLKK
ncbi:MAG: hypothetical protein RLO12_19015 [Fulvivirga sp.]